MTSTSGHYTIPIVQLPSGQVDWSNLLLLARSYLDAFMPPNEAYRSSSIQISNEYKQQKPDDYFLIISENSSLFVLLVLLLVGLDSASNVHCSGPGLALEGLGLSLESSGLGLGPSGLINIPD